MNAQTLYYTAWMVVIFAADLYALVALFRSIFSYVLEANPVKKKALQWSLFGNLSFKFSTLGLILGMFWLLRRKSEEAPGTFSIAIPMVSGASVLVLAPLVYAIWFSCARRSWRKSQSE